MPEVKSPTAKEIVAVMNACRSHLYLMDMITPKENAKIAARIHIYKSRNNVVITIEELNEAADRLFPK